MCWKQRKHTETENNMNISEESSTLAANDYAAFGRAIERINKHKNIKSTSRSNTNQKLATGARFLLENYKFNNNNDAHFCT